MAKKNETHTKKQKGGINPYILVIISFLIVILIGSVLLIMPFSRTDGKWGNYVDALFSATSATCVTGLCTYETGIGNTLNIFGQFVMVIMIQLGGLGFVTFLTFFITLFQSKLQFKNRYLLSQMVGSTNFADVVKFVRRLILISACFVAGGTIVGLPVFLTIPHKNFFEVLWNSFFMSASAFNNAGFDLFGSTSLIRGMGNPIIDNMPIWAYYYMCIYVMFLIVSGGISFLVIIDIFAFKKYRSWRAFTKIVLFTTATLLLSGWVFFTMTECFHSGGMTVFETLFQSVTLRTAGFATYNQDNVSMVGKAFSCLLMFIGGSPLSTAGGIKTTTAFMIALAMFSYFRGKEVSAFKRTYSTNMIVKAMSLVFIGLFIVLIGYLIIVASENTTDAIEKLNLNSEKNSTIIYEVFSAFGTVGVSTGITPYLTVWSKIVLCFLMFLGRLGPMTFLQIFQANLDRKRTLHYQFVEEDFLIG